MDPSAEERLKALQMADLGTARREYISTVDKPNIFSHVRLEEIEASRLSNVKGSDAQRLAEKNRAQLNAWANVHKEIDDTGDLEDLDTMMNGQSHRAHLSSMIKESGVQAYAESDDSLLKTSRRSPRRVLRSGGRGGGVIGTRGRRSSFPRTHSPTRTTSQGAVSKTGHHVIDSGRSRNRPLDPAVDPDREYFLKNKSRRGNTGSTRQQPQIEQQKSAPVKTRRPVLPDRDYEALLTPPQGFLAAYRSSRGASTAGTNPQNTDEVRKEAGKPELETVQRGDAPSASSQSPVATPVVSETKEPVAVTQTETLPLPQTSNTPHLTLESTPLPQPSNLAQAESSKLPEIAPSELHEQPMPEDKAKETEPGKTEQSKGFTSNLPRPEGLIEDSSLEEVQASKTKFDCSSDLLLDFEFTTPVVPASDHLSVASQKGVQLPSSPALADLMDIDFQQSQEAALPSKPSSLRPEQDQSFQETPTQEETMAVQDSPLKPPKALISNEAIAEYLKELALLNDLLATADTTTKAYIKWRKQQLETQISQAMMLKSTQDPTPSSIQQVEETAKATKSLETEKRENIPARKSASPVDSPLRNAVTAAPFVPSTNAYAYRSPAFSVSSSSTPTPTPSGVRVPATRTLIIGDHLLPGRRGSNQQTSTAHSSNSTSVLAGVTPPVFEGFGTTSQIGQSEFTFEMPANVSSSSENIASDSTTQGTSRPPSNVLNFPMSAATRQYANVPVSAATPQYAVNAPNLPVSAVTKKYAANVPNIPVSAATKQYAVNALNIPMSAAARQYAVNVPSPVSNIPTTQETSKTPTKVPYVPLSAATKQYTVNLLETEFARPPAPSIISPNVPRQHEQSAHAKSGEYYPSPSQTSKPVTTGLFVSRYSDPDPYSRRPLR
ncbi:hypothetical protein VTN00DRAFT_1386 [Thermoascus crustaceus]|uniref:uncharacterized protein n=1 Tax=Thermoascus crustaceus TaxID=5088 RepID=UPI0037438AFD